VCLDTIDKKTRKKVRYGYKVFDIYYDKIEGTHYSFDGCSFGNKPYELNKWYKSTDGLIYTEDDKDYETGFHIFTNKKDAKKWQSVNCRVIFKVELKNIVASGKQESLKCVVAKEMRILKEVK
jgi:hypothetical protein